jgi:hypothetical protein
MKTTISHASQFRDAFRQVDRHGQFSYEALNMLYEYFEDCDPDMELDVIAICCDYCEDTPANIARNYSIDLNDADPEDLDYDQACIDIVREYLQDNTTLVGETPAGFVYLSF